MTLGSKRLSWLLLSLTCAITLPREAASASAGNSDKVVILSVTDVKGKTSPCGCHIPKGGLSRQASFADSIRESFEQVAFVDNGGFFPETDAQRDVASFLMDAMKTLGMVAVGTSERELRWGIAFLKGEAARTGLPVLSANLIEVKTRQPALKPYVIQKVGRLKVGFFSLLSDKVDLGPARDSLKIDVPDVAARRTVDEMRKKGATVVVLLSQLGKVESEDLAASVPGIDAVICGHNVPLIQKGRMIKNTVTSYGGEQGQYMSRTLITVDGRGKMTGGENESFMLGPEVGEKPSMLSVVKQFEDERNERLRREERGQASADGAKTGLTR